MWNFLEWIRKGVEFLRVINKNPCSLGVLFFGLGIFKGYNTLLYSHTCYDFRFFQNFQRKPRNFNGVFPKAFPQSLCLFFFLEQTNHWQIDLLFWESRNAAHCLETPQIQICYRLHPKLNSEAAFKRKYNKK